MRDLVGGEFSFGRFYERRVRRILPALFLVLLCCLPLAWFTLFPDPLVEFSQSLLSTLFFMSNIFFWSQDAYTAEPAAFKPLLHTWSLAVEEQFYLLYPATLLLVWKYMRQHVYALLVVAFVASFALAVWAANHSPSANFYAMPTRLWELLAGALIAYRQFIADQRGEEFTTASLTGTLQSVLVPLGLVLVIAPMLLVQQAWGLPSWPTAVPVLGVVLILHYGGSVDIASRLLASRALVAGGLISYSLYLWHQPVFVFSRIRMGEEPGNTLGLLLAGLAVLLAIASYRWVEQPFRNRTQVSRKFLWLSMLLALLLLVAAAALAWQQKGFPQRLPPLVAQLTLDEIFGGALLQEGLGCHQREVDDACLFAGSGQPWYLVGDSNTYGLALPLQESLQARGAPLTVFTANGCYYAPSMLVVNDAQVQCSLQYNADRREFLLNAEPGVVVLAATLTPYYLGHLSQPELPPMKLQATTATVSETQRKQSIARVVRDSLAELLAAGHRVVLLYPIPDFPVSIPRVLAQTMADYRKDIDDLTGTQAVTLPWEVFQRRNEPVYKLLDDLGTSAALLRVYPAEVFCNLGQQDVCSGHDNSAIFFRDAFHLSPTGADMLVEEIMLRVDEAWVE